MATIETKYGCMAEVYIPANGYQKATVIEISIHRFNIRYCVDYFVNGENKTTWLFEEQLTTNKPEEKKISI
jgi:hypothetical protein